MKLSQRLLRVGALLSVALAMLHIFKPSWTTFVMFAAREVLPSVFVNIGVDDRELLCVEFVKQHAMRGNATDVYSKIDEFGWNQKFLMNVGDSKGEILSTALKTKRPRNVLEIGAYVGYSATRIGSTLSERKDTTLTSIEISHRNAALAREVLEYAGLSSTVNVVEGTVESVLKKAMKERGISRFDFVFIDHEKTRYLPDLLYLIDNDLLEDGAVVVGDNILFPGSPDYRAFVNSDSRFVTIEHSSHVEYLPIPDMVTVSRFHSQSQTGS